MPRHRLAAPAAAVLALGAPPAQAHLVSTGLGPVYDGIAHLALTPEDLIPVIALALLAGLRGAAPARWALLALPAFWLAGSLAGRIVAAPVSDLLPAASFILVGGLVALDAPLTPRIMAALAALVGVCHGYADGATLPTGATGVVLSLGIVATVVAVFALAVSLVLPLRSHLARTVVRVSGSWITAAGVLLLGWSLRAGMRLPDGS
jgi:hydrogenase/urease accessory protein HupE